MPTFFLMSSLIDSNKVFLQHQIKKIGIDHKIPLKLENSYSLNESGFKHNDCADTSIADWIQGDITHFVHPSMFLTEKGVVNCLSAISDLNISAGAKQYVGVTKRDPHMVWGLAKLREISILN